MRERVVFLGRRECTINRLALRAVPCWTSRAFVLSETTDGFHFQHGVANCAKYQIGVFVTALHSAKHWKNFCWVQGLRSGIASLGRSFVWTVFASLKINLIPGDAECFSDART